jgi:AcrR family transcriptional regulator
MRTHGWRGQPPATDEEAVARILEATDRCVRRSGARTSISDVASELGVSRATVYRYFEGTTDLLRAAAAVGTEEFVTEVGKRIASLPDTSDPATVIIEAIFTVVTKVPDEPYLQLLFEEPTHTLIQSVTSADAAALGRAVLSENTSVDWNGPELSERFDELLEWSLRVVQSLLSDPGDPPRSPEELREFLWRWVGPAIQALASGASARPQ